MSEQIVDPSGLFTPGPTLTTEPVGDTARQAVHSLRGYAYQVAASTAAWLDLTNGARLYLEVAEDYATLAENVLNAVQVKDTAASGSITLNSESVREAIAGYVKLVALNPNRAVQLHYLTTAQIGLERRISDRPAGEAGLAYWRRAASGAAVNPLREILDSADFPDEVRAFVRNCADDEVLRQALLRNIHWQCGQPDFAELQREIQDRLVVLGTDRYHLMTPDSSYLSNVLMFHVLKKSVEKNASDRFLTRAELDREVYSATAVTLPRSTVNALILNQTASAVVGAVPAGPSAAALSVGRDWLVSSVDIPLTKGTIARPEMKRRLVEALSRQGIVFAYGATGVGKSLLAREAAIEFAANFMLADARDATIPETLARLTWIVRRLTTMASRALVIEDLNQFEDPSVLLVLGTVANALRRRDRTVLITCYRPPSPRALSGLGIDQNAVIEVPYFTEAEVQTVVEASGGDPELWGRIAFLSGGSGHPQLVHAFVMGMAARGWPQNALKHIVAAGLTTEDVTAARDAARRQLVSDLPEGARKLLYRLSLIGGRFDRALALRLGALPPPLAQPGEELDHLIGSWVEFVSRTHYRVSPLVSTAGQELLAPDEQRSVHSAIAMRALELQTIDITEANLVFVHALLGKSNLVLFALAASILSAEQEQRKALREWFFSLRDATMDRLIYSESAPVSRMLRLAQFRLVAEGDNGAEISACVATLLSEGEAETDEELRIVSTVLDLGTVLTTLGIANHLPNWIALLLRLKTVLEEQHDLKSGFERVARDEAANSYAMLFAIGISGLASVARFEEIFVALSAIAPAERSTLLEAFDRKPDDYHVLVSAPWLAAQRRGTLDWADAASRYGRMAHIAREWGVVALAAECYAARAVMHDEYGEDSRIALQSLDDAEAVLGENVVTARARAKVLWRHQDYAGALAIMRLIADRVSPDSPIARCFALREAAISAAQTGAWEQAERWFDEAKAAGARARADDMPAMVIGLGADAALAAFQVGDRGRSLRQMAECLTSLKTLDPNSSLRAAYCHRVIRHAVLWLERELEGHQPQVENEPYQLPPGTCSNPEPLPAIRELPLGPLDLAWYMLAHAELQLGEDLGVVNSFRCRLEKGPITFFEVTLRNAWMQQAIRRSDSDLFTRHLIDWLDAGIYLREQGPELKRSFNVLDPARGEIPSVSPARRLESNSQEYAKDAMLAFLMLAALEHRENAAAEFEHHLKSKLGADFPGASIFYFLRSDKPFERNLEQVTAALIRRLNGGEHLEPKQVWEIGLRFFERARQSNFKYVIIPVLVQWMRAQWSRIISSESFRLKQPIFSVPKIEEVLRSDISDDKFLASLILATAPAVGLSLASEYHQLLQDVGNPQQTSAMR